MCSRGGGVHYFDESNDEVGTVLYYDTTDSKLHQKHYTQWNPSWKGDSIHIPVAIQVIPKSHAEAWGDGKARWVSVHGVNEDGTASDSDVEIDFSVATKVDVSDVCDYYKAIPVYNDSGKIVSGTSGYFSTVISAGTIPSPYNSKGGINEDYHTEFSNVGPNPLLDFDGKGNTSGICSKYAVSGFPALKACLAYSDSGTSAGDWYLPACGELAYLCVKYMEVMRAMFRIGCTHYKEDIAESDYGHYHKAVASPQPAYGTNVYGYFRPEYDDYNKLIGYSACSKNETSRYEEKDENPWEYYYAMPSRSVIDGIIYSRFLTSTSYGAQKGWVINFGNSKVYTLNKATYTNTRPFIKGNLNESTGKLE